jgi:transposase
MANQLKMAIVQAILQLHALGWSQRRIATELQIDRETVARYLKLYQNGAKPATAPPRHGGPKPSHFSRFAG